MNALHLVGVNVRTTKAPASAGAAMERMRDEHRNCHGEIQRLTVENSRLSGELERLRAAHDDLRGSAEVWIRLYEAQLQRTRTLEQRRHEEDSACQAAISPRR
jgi:predicted RNase H-like nuclease (RuvC/YqgF family)